jgi:hypothetical protein
MPYTSIGRAVQLTPCEALTGTKCGAHERVKREEERRDEAYSGKKEKGEGDRMPRKSSEGNREITTAI